MISDSCLLEDECKSEILTCPENAFSCEVNCANKATCKDAMVDANGADSVDVQCVAEDACSASAINCGLDARNGCNVLCDGKATCNDVFIDGSASMGDVSVTCGGIATIDNPDRAEDACKELIIECPDEPAECRITCIGDGSCLDVICIGCVCDAQSGGSCDGVITSTISAALSNNEKIIDTEVDFKRETVTKPESDGDSNAVDHENKQKNYTISLSESMVWNLWGMVLLFLVANVGFYCCYQRMKWKSDEATIE